MQDRTKEHTARVGEAEKAGLRPGLSSPSPARKKWVSECKSMWLFLKGRTLNQDLDRSACLCVWHAHRCTLRVLSQEIDEQWNVVVGSV